MFYKQEHQNCYKQKHEQCKRFGFSGFFPQLKLKNLNLITLSYMYNSLLNDL